MGIPLWLYRATWPDTDFSYLYLFVSLNAFLFKTAGQEAVNYVDVLFSVRRLRLDPVIPGNLLIIRISHD